MPIEQISLKKAIETNGIRTNIIEKVPLKQMALEQMLFKGRFWRHFMMPLSRVRSLKVQLKLLRQKIFDKKNCKKRQKMGKPKKYRNIFF
jgi:hypothetical protein